jgi:D-alanine-D-alanine ligase
MASLDRIIPAELSDERTQAIQDLAVRIFQLFDCAGVARIDFMIDEATGEVFFNEINTIPGSFSFYLWEPSGVPFDDLVHRLIEIARRRHREKNGRIRYYDVNLLSEKSLSGLAGTKGAE